MRTGVAKTAAARPAGAPGVERFVAFVEDVP
jgi:hypothetical protein